MIRVVAVSSLLALLILVLYVPSAHPPQRFLNQIRIEHEATSAFWGAEPAVRILSRGMQMQDGAGFWLDALEGRDGEPPAPEQLAVIEALSRTVAANRNEALRTEAPSNLI